MPAIGYVQRQQDGSFKGSIRTLSVNAEIAIIPNRSKSGSSPTTASSRTASNLVAAGSAPARCPSANMSGSPCRLLNSGNAPSTPISAALPARMTRTATRSSGTPATEPLRPAPDHWRGAFPARERLRVRAEEGLSTQEEPASGGGRTASRTAGPHHFASQNRHPHRRLRDRFAVPDPARPPPDQTSCLELEEARMSIEQQLEELRAELRACDEEEEIAMIRAELAAALAQKAALELHWKRHFRWRTELQIGPNLASDRHPVRPFSHSASPCLRGAAAASIGRNPEFSFVRNAQPVIDLQPIDPAEFALIVCHQRRIERQRVRGNQHVVRADRRS